MTIRRQTAFSATALALACALPAALAAAAEPEAEFLCLKTLDGPYADLSIACYTDAGCAYVQKLGAEPLPDYDQESVAAALGREKIEGIVTSSDTIMKKIKGWGYSCKKAE